MNQIYDDALKKAGISITDKSKDPRIVHGVGCTWWDSIEKVKVLTSGLPCCPYCSSLLLEVKNEEEWFTAVDEWEAEDHKGYRKFVEWLRGKCFKTAREGIIEYKETGNSTEFYKGKL